MALVGELVAESQWLTPTEAESLGPDAKSSVAAEMADVFIHLVRMTDAMGIDLFDTTDAKMHCNATRFPTAASHVVAHRPPKALPHPDILTYQERRATRRHSSTVIRILRRFRTQGVRVSVFMQPASPQATQVKRNYRRTISRPVRLSDHADVLDPQVLRALELLFPSGEAPMWGVKPGKNEDRPRQKSPVAEFHALRPGDVVFFTGDSKLYFGGTVALTWINDDLANRLWGIDRTTGKSWRYMYALTEVQSRRIPMSEVRKTVGWKNEDRHVRSFGRLKPAEADGLLELLSWNTASTDSADMDALEKSDTYDGELVREAVRKARGEQDALRKKLFPDTTARCELCGRDLPTELLVAAHIKKRQHCTDNERRSMEVVMAACRLGCDELYERGLITVADDGSISISPQVASWTSVEDYVKERLANRTVANWHEGQRPVFYRWHRTHTFRGGVDL